MHLILVSLLLAEQLVLLLLLLLTAYLSDRLLGRARACMIEKLMGMTRARATQDRARARPSVGVGVGVGAGAGAGMRQIARAGIGTEVNYSTAKAIRQTQRKQTPFYAPK